MQEKMMVEKPVIDGQTMMNALTQDRYGSPTDVLRVDTVPVPDIDDDEVLVAVEASSINPADWHGVRGEPMFIRPFTGFGAPSYDSPGADVAGIVERVGASVTGIRAGDRVVGYPPEKRRGGFAQFAVLPAADLALLPDEVTSVDAACLPLAGGTALQGLRDHGGVAAADQVMIVGASGGVGSLAVQIAKHLGATVTAVCSGRNIDFVAGLGADVVIDYTVDDYVQPPAGSEGYDVIFQLGGAMPASQLRAALAPSGRLVVASGDGGGRWFGPVGRILRGVAMSRFGRGRVLTMNAVPTKADLEQLVGLVSSGSLRAPVETTVRLAEVPRAIRDIETGHTRGKISVVI